METDRLIENKVNYNYNNYYNYNNSKIYLLFLLLTISIILQTLCLFYLIQFSNTAEKFNIFSYNETEINSYVNKIELIVDYICKKIVLC
jgi:hypothetical protein